MSAYALLNLLNELRKSDKMRGLPNILSLFRNEFNKFNITGTRVLDSINQMLFLKTAFAWKRPYFYYSTQRSKGRHYVTLHEYYIPCADDSRKYHPEECDYQPRRLSLARGM